MRYMYRFRLKLRVNLFLPTAPSLHRTSDASIDNHDHEVTKHETEHSQAVEGI